MPLWASDVIILTVRIIKIKLNVVDSVEKKALNHDYKTKTKQSTPKISKGKNIKKKKMRGNKKKAKKKNHSNKKN